MGQSEFWVRTIALIAAAVGCSGSDKGSNENYVINLAKRYEDYLRVGK